jgi:hypothetical protein
LLISLPNDQRIKVSFINGKIDDSIAQSKENYCYAELEVFFELPGELEFMAGCYQVHALFHET